MFDYNCIHTRSILCQGFQSKGQEQDIINIVQMRLLVQEQMFTVEGRWPNKCAVVVDETEMSS